MGLLFLAFFLLVGISVAATSWTIETQQKDALIINLAGRQRMLSQQMSKEVWLGVVRGQDSRYLDKMHVTAHQFEEGLRGLLDGGEVTYAGTSVSVPPATDPPFRAALEEVQAAWEPLHQAAHAVLENEPTSPAFTQGQADMERLPSVILEKMDTAVRLYQAAAEARVARLHLIQALFFISALVLLAGGSLVVQRLIISPLQHLTAAAEQIGHGDLNTPVRVQGSREIRSLSQSFDTMRAQLRASQETLRAWAAQLETRVAQRTRELAALYEISREISSRLDINHVLRSVTDKAREVLDGEIAALCLLNDEGQALNLQAISGPQEAIWGTRMLAQQLPAHEVLAGDRAIPCDVDTCGGMCGIIAAPFRISHLAAPLRVGERVIGALCVGSSRPATFSPEATDMLTKLANSAAVALENARLYEQAQRVATLEERQRIAAEMHDGLAQALGYLGLKTEQVAELVAAGREEEAIQGLQRIRTAIDQASLQVRHSIASLQANPQPRQALQDHLARLVDEFATDGVPGVDLATNLQTALLLPPNEVEQVLRVAREALLNARRHAHAEHITVCLEQHGTEARLIVEDDGRGFDCTALPPNGSAQFGLSIMRARAARIGGRLAIHSSIGQGTQVVLTWPIHISTLKNLP